MERRLKQSQEGVGAMWDAAKQQQLDDLRHRRESVRQNR
jgi:hypothetical protein